MRSESFPSVTNSVDGGEVVQAPAVCEDSVSELLREDDDVWCASTSYVNYSRPRYPRFFGPRAGEMSATTRQRQHRCGLPPRLQPRLLVLVACALAAAASLAHCSGGGLCTGVVGALWLAVLAAVGWPLARHALFCALETERSLQKMGVQPRRIIIVRHAESEGNSDLSKYRTTADNQIALTERGVAQARQLGVQLRHIVGDESCRFFVSPYKRTWQTLAHLLETMKPSLYTIREEPRVREQDWGNFQTDPELIERQIEERRRFGSFFYRMQNGESGADVFARIDSFWSSLFREFQVQHCLENFVIVTHGISARLLLMRYFGWTVDEFHSLHNFANAQFAVLERINNCNRYTLVTPVRKNPHQPSPHVIAAQRPLS